MKPLVHQSSFVDAGAVVGDGTRIWHFCHVMSGARIGANCTLGQNVMIAGGVTIGSGVKIQNNVSVYDGVTLEEDVFVGPSVVFTNVINPRARVDRKREYRPTLVKQGATIGANATIVCGVTIGRHAFIGAGAVVTRDVADHALVVGAPARLVAWMCECGEKLPIGSPIPYAAACRTCRASYSVIFGSLWRSSRLDLTSPSEDLSHV